MDTRITDFHYFLKSVSEKFSSVAIFNSDFKCLHVHSRSINNSVGLMNGLKTLKPFFPWDGTHVVIHNDPLLGCSRIDRVQFLFSIDSFHFAIEEAFSINWELNHKIIKIPPIPIVENKKVNNSLIETLSSQPDCPKDFHGFVLKTLETIETFQQHFKTILKFEKYFSNKELHKDYLDSASAFALKTIKSKTYSVALTEFEFEPGSFLKLKVSTSETGVRVDFQGTTNHPLIQMADSMTDSICFHFFADYFQFLDLMNEATFSLFQIAKPTQSLANSKIFSQKLYSDFVGPDLLVQALIDGLAERSPLKPYLFTRSYFQIVNGDQNKTLNFELANSKPIGSLGVSYMFEPLLISKPTPSGTHLPGLELFYQFGLEVLGCQSTGKSGRTKENNDSTTTLQLRCVTPLRLNVLHPHLPSKTRPNKSKGTYSKPTLQINGALKDKHSFILELKPNDILEIKTGSIEFPST